MKLHFLGGADEVGASCTLVEIEGRRLLVDEARLRGFALLVRNSPSRSSSGLADPSASIISIGSL